MTGCENFLNGENIKDDIVREIYISNHECPEAKVSDYYASFFAGSAVPHSNHSILVNVFASSCDLGSDSDEWESAVSEVYTMLGF